MSNEIKVTVRQLGETRVDVMNIMPPAKKSKNPLAWTGLFRPIKDQRIIPCTTYIIEHPKGLVVIDTGFDKKVRKYPILELSPIHYQINKPIQGEGQAVDEILASLGYKPSDIEYLVLSHLHSDHADGARQLIGAKHIVCSKDELDGATKKDLVTFFSFLPHWRKGLPLETFEFEDTGIGPVGKSYDLFGDGTIQLVKLPGHTAGMCGALICNNGKQLLLAADCGYTKRAYLEGIVPAVVTNLDDFRNSLNYLKEVYEQPETLDVLVNHDIGVLDNTQYVL